MSLPGITVSIEDRSLALNVVASGRSGYVVVMADRGPHNKVVEVTSLGEFQRIFGKPNIGRTGQAHYLADKFLQRANKLFVVRPALLDNLTPANNSHIAHATVSENTTTLLTTETYTWTNGSNTISTADSTTLSVADSIGSLTAPLVAFAPTTLSVADSQSTTSLAMVIPANSTVPVGGVTAAALTIPVTSTAGMATAGTVLIGTEQITYTGKTPTTLTGAIRGANATVAAAHVATSVVSPIEIISTASTAGYPTTGTVLIGSEQIAYTGTTATSFTGLTRGANATAVATHANASVIFNTDNLNVVSTAGMATFGTVIIGTEQIVYTGTTATTITGLTRAANATTVAAHASGAAVTPIEVLAVTTTTGYPAAGNILIGSELIAYTGTTALTFTGLTRGSGGTVIASHASGSAAIDANVLTVVSTTGFSTAGIISIGSEQITYTGTTATTFTGLTRGVNSTIAATHALATVVSSVTSAVPVLIVGDWIVPSSVTDLALARQVVSISSNYSTITLDANYTGATVTIAETVKYFQPLKITTAASTDISQLVETTYTFAHNSNLVTTTISSTAVVGDWIISAGDVDNIAFAQQILSISADLLTLTLVSGYLGTTSTIPEAASTFNTAGGITTSASLSTTTTGILFHIYAQGVGAFYNDIVIRAVRNTAYEKMFIDNNGNPLYPNNFLDLFIYTQNQDGSLTLVEGPWTVSLINVIDGQVVRDINTGRELYFVTVVNFSSKFIQISEGASILDYSTAINALELRQYTQSLLASGVVAKSSLVGQNGIGLAAGDDGLQFTPSGLLNMGNTLIQGIINQAYAGTLTSTDGSIELISQSQYPWYEFDYILAGGYNSNIQASAVSLADNRNDVMVLADTGSNTNSAASDLALRSGTVTFNSFNVMLYTQYRKIFDVYTGADISITPVYHAIDRHLLIDARDWIAEPVAGIEKGAIQEPIELSYKPDLTRLAELVDVELNPTIVEAQGKYILHQLTTWKRLSIMKRGHAVKFVHYIKKEIPKLLKDILQHKATPFWIHSAKDRVSFFMNPFVDGFASTSRLTAVTSYTVDVQFDTLRSELQVALMIKPIRSIEVITVSILVQ